MSYRQKLQDEFITLAHGNGGRYMRELIDGVFEHYLGNDCLDTRVDAAFLPMDLDGFAGSQPPGWEPKFWKLQLPG